MIKQKLFDRLRALEQALSPDPLIVEAKDGDAIIRETARECIANNHDFLRVVSGENLADLDALLAQMKEDAEREGSK